MNRKFLLSLLVLGLFACASKLERKKVEFPNKFVVTASDCKKWKMPEVEFSIQYPDSVKCVFPSVDSVNDNYISLVDRKDEINFEELTIGWFTGGSNLEFMNLGIQLLNQFESIFKSVDPKAETEFKGKRDFLNFKGAYQLQMVYEVEDESLGGDPGKYKLMTVLVPNTDLAKNGVLVFFQTNDNNKIIRKFSDFGVNGLTGDIWNTFEFN